MQENKEISKKKRRKILAVQKKVVPLQPLTKTKHRARQSDCKGFASLAQLARARDL